MFATMGITAIEIAPGQNAFAFGQVHAALHASHHLLCRSGCVLFWRLPAKGSQQQKDGHDHGQQKK
jgi:hypothetical protein